MVIRPAQSEDFPAIAAITNHYITTTSIHFAYEPVAADELRGYWHTGPRYPWLVADDDGVVLGYSKAGPWRDRAAYAWTCEIGVYVAEGARGRKLGTALYGELLDELERRGFRSAIAGIALPNDASLALHRHFGFTHVGTFADAGWKNGAWHAVDFWQKSFSTGPEAPVE